MKNKKIIVLVFNLSGLIFLLANSLYAQGLSNAAREQRESKIEDRRDEREDLKKPKTAQEIIEYLKERAGILKKERRLKELLETKFSAGYTFGIETNPANDSLQKGDEFSEEDFSMDWVPTFTKKLSGDAGYRLTKQNYFEEDTLSTFDHTVSGSLKWIPFKSGKVILTPMAEYDWLVYPNDVSSEYEQSRFSLDFKYYIGQKWSYGGKYEWSDKVYDKKVARNTDEVNLNFLRQDFRNSIETWIKWYIGKYSVQLKEKSYRNNSNDEFQKFNDYDSHRGYITFSRSFMKDGKLYLSYNSNYEVKAYSDRLADERIARHDQIIEHKLNAYYTLKSPFTLSPSVSYRKSNGNDVSAGFKDVTYKIGLTADF